MQDWPVVENGIQTWLYSRHLQSIVVEFFKRGASTASARWDFPLGYVGLGVNDDMWPDKAYLRRLIAKSARPTADCTYASFFASSLMPLTFPASSTARF